MISKIHDASLFAKLFSLGLLLLFIDAFKAPLSVFMKSNSSLLDTIPFFAIGAILCLISLLFLLIEWVALPFGTQTKRIKLYQGLGNIFAFAMLTAAWLFKETHAQGSVNTSSVVFSLSGLAFTVIFGWAGSNIADIISRKRIRLEQIG